MHLHQLRLFNTVTYQLHMIYYMYETSFLKLLSKLCLEIPNSRNMHAYRTCIQDGKCSAKVN